jgi:hypothetical protein
MALLSFRPSSPSPAGGLVVRDAEAYLEVSFSRAAPFPQGGARPVRETQLPGCRLSV